MKRLTYKDASGNWVVACNKFWNYMKLKFPAHIQGEAVDRLAAYENTGVEPTDVITAPNMAKIACALHELNQYKEIGNLDRLRDLVEADKAGRCVVLPDRKHTSEDGENALKSAMNTCYYHNNPVTRYIADAVVEKLVREAAQDALKGGADQ